MPTTVTATPSCSAVYAALPANYGGPDATVISGIAYRLLSVRFDSGAVITMTGDPLEDLAALLRALNLASQANLGGP
jgi:hypothetical protein